MQWAVEGAQKTGNGTSTIYGATWFPAWQAVVALPAVAEALAKGSPGKPGAPTALVVGSALGEQCLFALALGFGGPHNTVVAIDPATGTRNWRVQGGLTSAAMAQEGKAKQAKPSRKVAWVEQPSAKEVGQEYQVCCLRISLPFR